MRSKKGNAAFLQMQEGAKRGELALLPQSVRKGSCKRLMCAATSGEVCS
jgi:hypothetical protein